MTVRIPHIVGILLSFLLVPAVAYGASTARVVVYVTYSTCPTCPTDPLLERFQRYVSELWAALREMGIEVRTIDLEPELRWELAGLYQKLGVPDDMRATYTLVVSIDQKFLFINHVPVRIITDFLANHAEKYERIAVFRDEARNLYKVMDDKGNVMEGKIENSITDILPFPPWSILSLVVVSGLLDGINPCAFAVLLFLVTLLFAMGTTTWEHPQQIRRTVLLFGSTYILAVYLTYLIIGLTLRQAIMIVPFYHLVSKMGALVVIAAGIIKIKDRFWPGRGVSLKLSPSRWETTRKWMRKATLPATFITGTLVALFEFPCTGGIYFAILSILATRTTFVEGLTYLLLYNVAFILPLMAILILASKKEIIEFSLRKWQQQEAKSMGLVEGLIYIGLGAFLLLSGIV